MPLSKDEAIMEIACVGASLAHGIMMEELLYTIYPNIIKLVGSVAVTAAGEIGEFTTIVDV